MNWQLTSLEDVCSLITDGAHWSPKGIDDGIPMPSVKDMTAHGFDYTDAKKISNDDFQKLKKSNCVPLKDDVLVAKDGSYLKHCFRFRGLEEIAVLSSIAIFRPKLDIINPNFFAYLFNTPQIKKLASNYVSGVAVPRIVLADFKKIQLPIPPIKEQRRIASILSAYDDLIENNLKRIQLLEEAAMNIYREWFVHFRFPGHEEVEMVEDKKGRKVPEGWEFKHLNEISKVSSSKRVYANEYVNEGIPFYRGQEITNKANYESIVDPLYISESKYIELKKKTGAPEVGDILITAVGTIGNVYLVRQSDEDFYFKDGNVIWVRDLSEDITPEYLFQYFRSQEFVGIVRSINIGSSQRALTITALKRVEILVPESSTLHRFQNVSKSIQSQIDILTRLKQKLKEGRDILLPRLMNQTIEV